MSEILGGNTLPNFPQGEKYPFPSGALANALAEVPELLKQGAKTVFFMKVDQKINFSILQKYTDSDSKLRYFGALGEEALESLKSLLARLPAETENIAGAIIEDVEHVLAVFPERKLKGITLTGVSRDKRGVEAGPWHTDDLGSRIRILKTYTGPSTEFADDARGLNTVASTTGTTIFLTRDSVHRSPAISAGVYRLLLLMEIE